MADPADEIESDLVDLTGLSLGQVRSLDDSALGIAVRAVLATANNPEEPLVGFQSRI